MPVWATIPARCDWNNPGVNPFRGSPLHAVLGYEDIPIWPRLVLATRAGFGVTPTDYATITRGYIASATGYSYAPVLTDMHFGKGEKCALPDRTKWPESRQEPAAVWCFQGHCVAIPNVCSNVSRIWLQAPELRSPSLRGDSWKNPQTVPEPSTLILAGLAGLAMKFSTRRRR